MKYNIFEGRWIQINSLKEFDSYQNGRCNKGEYSKPGKYMIFEYNQRCPRGCCYDDVVELVHSDDIVYEIKEKMTDLANLLKEAKQC